MRTVERLELLHAQALALAQAIEDTLAELASASGEGPCEHPLEHRQEITTMGTQRRFLCRQCKAVVTVPPTVSEETDDG